MDVNNYGVVVGEDDNTAILWVDGVRYDLNDLVSNFLFGNRLITARAINDCGMIVADSETFDVYLLIPVDGTFADDTDGDGLLDRWEICGVDGNEDGRLDLALPGADPRHKDVYVEADALSGRVPTPGALEMVVASFANAPVADLNPDGLKGIRLHIPGRGGVDPAIDDEAGDNVAWSWPVQNELEDHKDEYYGTVWERTVSSNWSGIKAARDSCYRYACFAREFSAKSTDGVCFGAPGRDMVVALGMSLLVGEEDYAGVFMHELGHALGLEHGGANDTTNAKPNYKSVMNYLWTHRAYSHSSCNDPSDELIAKYTGSWAPDYSRSELPTLDENSLDESAGIGGDPTMYVPVGGPYGPFVGYANIVPMGGPVDWDRSGTISLTAAEVDANNVPGCAAVSGFTPGDVLQGHEDWHQLQYRVADLPSSAKSFALNSAEIPDEPTIEQYQQLGSLPLDCNNNGQPDKADIRLGVSMDADLNGVPDECDHAVSGVDPVLAASAGRLRVSRNPMWIGSPTSLLFTLAARARVAMRIFAASGELVQTVCDEQLEAGGHELHWDGRSSSGRWVPSGIYFVRLTADERHDQARVLLLH